ncbi:MAG: hypothetical protein KGJ62_12435 [Armatimonadetes bacterium]|nr:hypothetical protein [Armatimonadota bacterium]MDE2207870.1 hypothetical protein [Armatimonadota bacterium]
MYTPYDFNEAVSRRTEFIQDKLVSGSPVVGMAVDAGVMLFSMRHTQRKIYEIYDRQMFAALGNQSDVETIRLSAIQIAHQEGFERSPDDVTIHRLVGFALSPSIKKAFGDQLSVPWVVRAVFAELGRSPESDSFVTLNYDGEYQVLRQAAVVAGSFAAEEAMRKHLEPTPERPKLSVAIDIAARAWAAGARADRTRRSEIRPDDRDEVQAADDGEAVDSDYLNALLEDRTPEVGLLERTADGAPRFRLVPEASIREALAARL